MPPINDPFYRKSVDEILDSDSDHEEDEQQRFEQLFDTEYGLEQIDGLFEQTLPSNEFIEQGFQDEIILTESDISHQGEETEPNYISKKLKPKVNFSIE